MAAAGLHPSPTAVKLVLMILEIEVPDSVANLRLPDGVNVRL